MLMSEFRCKVSAYVRLKVHVNANVRIKVQGICVCET